MSSRKENVLDILIDSALPEALAYFKGLDIAIKFDMLGKIDDAEGSIGRFLYDLPDDHRKALVVVLLWLDRIPEEKATDTIGQTQLLEQDKHILSLMKRSLSGFKRSLVNDARVIQDLTLDDFKKVVDGFIVNWIIRREIASDAELAQLCGITEKQCDAITSFILNAVYRPVINDGSSFKKVTEYLVNEIGIQQDKVEYLLYTLQEHHAELYRADVYNTVNTLMRNVRDLNKKIDDLVSYWGQILEEISKRVK